MKYIAIIYGNKEMWQSFPPEVAAKEFLIGTTLLKQGMEKIVAGRATLADMAATESLANTVVRMSRCGLGQTAPNPILSTLRYFKDEYIE